jgi:hypothetical protein
MKVVGVQLHVASLLVAVQIVGSAGHGVPPLRHVVLVFLIEDGCTSHHQVGIIIRLRVRPVFEEMSIEELIVELDNGFNVVVRPVGHRCSLVGKWPNMSRAGADAHSSKPPHRWC